MIHLLDLFSPWWPGYDDQFPAPPREREEPLPPPMPVVVLP